MKIPLRNTWSATIMGWIDGEEATLILADADKHRDRIQRLRAEMSRAQRDARRIDELQAKAAAIAIPARSMAAAESDVIGRPALPKAAADQEALYADAREIADAHIDQGDGSLYSTPESHIDFCRQAIAEAQSGLARTGEALQCWAQLAVVAIDSEPGYALEDGRRFASAAAAEAADTLPSDVPEECQRGHGRAVDALVSRK